MTQDTAPASDMKHVRITLGSVSVQMALKVVDDVAVFLFVERRIR